jgi:tripartite-type tricarboxylate transporter receptor subunit TctC
MTMRGHALLFCLLFLPCGAWSQAWPSKPIRVVIPYLPGATDIGMRLLIPKMQERLGQPLVIENRAGANGAIGSQSVARSAPDGYTLLYTNANPLVFGPATQKNVPYDPVKDFTPIMAVSEGIWVMVASPSLPAGSVKELIEHARANPGKLFYGSTGMGGAQHIAGENFNRMAGTSITVVHYVSYAQALPAVMSGQVAYALVIVQAARPLVASGKLKLIGVVEPKRVESLPEVGAVAEVLPGFEKPSGWVGLLGPARLPQPILDRVHAAVFNAATTPEMTARFTSDGNRVIADTPEQFSARLKHGVESIARMVKELDIKVTE